MLAAHSCAFPNIFPWFGADPYEALWHVAALCGIVLGLEAVVVYVLTHSRWVSGVLGVMCLAAGALTIIAGRMALVGLVCAGVPGASQQLSQQANESYNTLVVLQSLGILLVVSTMVLLVLGALLVSSRRHRYLLGEESGIAESR
jgi:hypothetical protein